MTSQRISVSLMPEMTKHRPTPPLTTVLSQRENDVLKLVAVGRRNKQIAVELEITENTVETHLKVIFKKLKVHTRVEATLVRTTHREES